MIIKTLFVALAATMQLAAAEVYGVNDPLMAEYEGFWTASNGTRGRVTAQIRPIGNNQYDGFILLKRAKATVTAFKLNHSAPENGTLKFEGATAKEAGGDLLARNEVSAELKGGRLTGKFKGELSEGTFEAGRSERKSPTLGARPPKHAVVLFDGSKADGWKNMTWPVKDGVLEVGNGNIQAKETFSSYRLHLEFRTPYMPEAKGQERGNSGVYLQGKYEVQVLDSFGLYPLRDNDCGGIYSVKAPTMNACFPPMEWQTYDITYIEGSDSGAPRVTISLNGTVIAENVEIPPNVVEKGTGGGSSEPGFLMLQNHGNPVQFRNIWAQPIFSTQKRR